MRNRPYLLLTIAQAVLMVMAPQVALAFRLFVLRAAQDSNEGMLRSVVFLGLIGLATWWVFRKLQPRYSRREAKALAATFVVFSPISSIAAYFAWEIAYGRIDQVSGYRLTDLLADRPFLGLGTSSVAIFLVVVILDFAVCEAVLWVGSNTYRAKS
jgi:hypothetical protein